MCDLNKNLGLKNNVSCFESVKERGRLHYTFVGDLFLFGVVEVSLGITVTL